MCVCVNIELLVPGVQPQYVVGVCIEQMIKMWTFPHCDECAPAGDQSLAKIHKHLFRSMLCVDLKQLCHGGSSMRPQRS